MMEGLGMKVDLSALERAVEKLRAGIDRVAASPDDDQIRDGLVQRFEFTYELSHNRLRRFLASRSASAEDVRTADFATLIRMADEQDLLLGGWASWKRWRELRSKSSHTYDEDVAMEVVQEIPAFHEEALHLLRSMQAGSGR
jgi:nucleotidyltransferase substrate binding protein (TIGR01987 family)